MKPKRESHLPRFLIALVLPLPFDGHYAILIERILFHPGVILSRRRRISERRWSERVAFTRYKLVRSEVLRLAALAQDDTREAREPFLRRCMGGGKGGKKFVPKNVDFDPLHFIYEWGILKIAHKGGK